MKNKPTIMYIHGFRSGANGSKREELQRQFGDRFRVITPEVDADPEKALAIINSLIDQERPQIIIGTSLGGWMAVMCDSRDAQIVIVNPSVDPALTLGRWVGQQLPYFCPRLDGVQTYTLTQEVLDKYRRYDFPDKLTRISNRVHALCSSNDELIGDIHIRALQPLLTTDHLTIADDFGHRCSGPGMTHLLDILNRLTAS